MLPTALLTTGGNPQSCAMRFGICQIAAGNRMRRHSPICPGMPSLTVGKTRPASGELISGTNSLSLFL